MGVTDVVQVEPGGTADIGELSRRTRDLVLPAMRPCVERLPAEISDIVGYHFGWLDEAGGPAAGSPGKLLRPTLTLLCAEAVGAARDPVVSAAVAVELMHNFTLVHDDVMDEDPMRRHRPTVWSRFGVPNAILAGDAMLALAIEILAEAAPESVPTLCTTVRDLCGGQYLDLSFEERDEVGLDECLAMVDGKTASLLRCACELGAELGGGTTEQVSALTRFGRHLGIAFQLVDDMLGIWGDPAVTGKPAGSDLLSRKQSLPVVAALSAGGSRARRLATFYRRPEPPDEGEAAEMAELVDRAGGRRWSLVEADRQLDAALGSLSVAAPEPAAGRALLAVAQAATRRTS